MEQIASDSLPDILRASYDCIHTYGPCHILLIRMNVSPHKWFVYVDSRWSEEEGFPATATPSTDSSRAQRRNGDHPKLTHAFMTFSVSLTFYFLFYKGAVPEGRAVALGTSVFTLGVTVGACWEIFEWFFVYKHPMADTISDLLVNSVGALAAALVALALRRSGDRLT
jgi:VanZ family protein